MYAIMVIKDQGKRKGGNATYVFVIVRFPTNHIYIPTPKEVGILYSTYRYSI